ncbi:two-component system histidine kinase [Microlunatus phosphovorus NM-1]|uniref:histidine kinase n=1 Tax=Microlunatus phosphovorus (strain ATCC 700054 / DSM 10555 / JCM 9379 / NBRC 101784 / NCIMB 13414 / VKM Ac-1990 / NM-1) TaxID=1032480 RepID=F5XQW2_MICPN|nr:sensor histidine kinase [Microlunatus phosphovorus]BAK36984.1 two-component system histidine kinase [Microlunatus phosphovorus NM-1]
MSDESNSPRLAHDMTSSGDRVRDPDLPVARGRSWALDLILAGLVTGICVPASDPWGRDAMVLSLLLTSSLLVRRSHPRVALAWATTASLLQVYYLPTPTLSIVVVPMIVYAVTRNASPRTGLVALWIGLAGAVIGPARWSGLTDNPIAFAVTATACAAIVTGAYLLGRQLREQQINRRQRAQAELERLRLQQSEQEQRARAVAIDERSRIARELHDIVAHSLSVIVVQAEGGRAVVLKRPEVGAEVLDTIAETGRTSLAEMRRIVDVLRGGSAEASYLPSPGLGDLAELVARSGDRFQLLVRGTTPAVPAAIGLTVYRVVQESITNVLKHAGPAATAQIRIDYLPASIEIEVSDDGRGAAAHHAATDSRAGAAPEPGHGLRGMAERVSLMHGRLDARPRPGGGFVVRASIPLPATTTTGPVSGSSS